MGKKKMVCGCRHVAEEDIIRAVDAGATSYREVKKATGAGTKCGKCRKKVERTIARALEERKVQDAASAETQLPEDGAALPRFSGELSKRCSPADSSEPRQLVVHGIYRHFKGDYYLVEDVATGSEDGMPYVVYRKLYGDGSLWVRPLDMFLSPVDRKKYPDAAQTWRFELQEVGSVQDKA